MKLLPKTRHTARVHKVYDKARTPYQRLVESGVLAPHRRKALEKLYYSLNPVRLPEQISQELERL